ncbi:MAG: methyltransferase domain-containing protein [Elusimicrobia bacterium]|nr:methyltransferase domain-containing protein [Elusimicrobiota bacterium]
MNELASRSVDRCRICGSPDLHRYLDLGRTPLANSYLAEADLAAEEFAEELCLQLCRACGLSQLTRVVHPDRMFRHYLYVSATTATIREHFAEFAATAAKVCGAKPGDLGLDIASNDGTLLKGFLAAGMKAVGVDPAENLAREANAAGLPTVCAYFDEAAARRLAAERGRPKAITAANVFAHADDLQAFMRGVAACLAPEGVFAIECPYLLDFVERNEFDTAYHEHLSYIGITPLTTLMKAHRFEVFDVEYFKDIHGGSVRVWCARAGERPATARLAGFLAREKAFGVTNDAPYDAFARRVRANREGLRRLIGDLRAKGATIWAYGASAKGNTLMNFFGLKAAEVPRAIDDNPKKWGLCTPGARMRIVGIDALRRETVDYLLLLAWNFEAEIRRRCLAAGYRGRFIIPVPEARVAEEG